MKRPILITTALLACGALLAGCTETTTQGRASEGEVVAGYDLAPAAVLAENEDYTTVNADEWSELDAVDVKLSRSGLADSAGVASGVAANGSVVTITEAGVYRLTGEFEGQVRVEAGENDLVVLLLDGVEINNSAGAAIEVVSADDVAIHLAEGSENTISDAASYSDDAEANAAIYSQADLTISGSGALTVQGNGNDGIASKDDLVILGGHLSVSAADDALRGKDSLVVEGGILSLSATTGDGLKSDGDDGAASADIDWTRGYIYVRGGEIDITAGDDGLQAFTDTVIASGTVTASAADDGVKAEVTVAIGESEGLDAPIVRVTDSEEGVEAANVAVTGASIDVTANDDGINASGNAELQALIDGTEYVEGNREADTGERLEILSGTVVIAAGFDGLDSNGTLTISGGTVDITAAERGGDGPIDANGMVDVADDIVTANGSAWDAESAGAMGGFDGGPGPGDTGDPRSGGPGLENPGPGAPGAPGAR